MTGAAVVALVIGVPAAAFTLWPLLRRGRTFLPVPPDERAPLLEQKRQVLRALRELAFEHEAGHVSDDDYAELRARYEGEAALVLTELDRVAIPPTEASAAEVRRRSRGPKASPWRHPVALTASAIAILVFGVGLGVGIVRYTTPDPAAGLPMLGSRPLASLEPAAPPSPGRGREAGAQARAVSPEMLRGMLQAARTSLFEGRYGEAIAAYQAVLKRDPKNVDALTHLGLIVAIGGHADSALETFDRALAIDPDYPPALLYRGYVLYEVKRDTAGAVRVWEKFLAVTPPGQDQERVKQLIAQAKARK